jgi:hypothetical protein
VDLVLNRYKFTNYFENEVMQKRDYIKKEWCIRIIKNPLKIDVQDNQRVRFWGVIKEFDNKVFRVVTLSDRVTIHNIFPDRRFKS